MYALVETKYYLPPPVVSFPFIFSLGRNRWNDVSLWSLLKKHKDSKLHIESNKNIFMSYSHQITDLKQQSSLLTPLENEHGKKQETCTFKIRHELFGYLCSRKPNFLLLRLYIVGFISSCIRGITNYCGHTLSCWPTATWKGYSICSRGA